jgi:GLPGLI family protein
MKLLIIIGLCSSISASGQGIFGTKAAALKTIDTAAVKCYYLFSKKKAGADQAFRTDTMVLEIGAKVAKFYDPAKFGRDSMLRTRINSIDPQTIKAINIYKEESSKDLSNLPGTTLSSSAEGESYQLIKERASTKITVFDYTSAIGDRFKYEDEPGMLPWKISAETDTVAGYSCQKATLSFRGRDYIAWFAPDVPINEGPWKFKGLPGLILKVTDTKDLFSFKLIGLQQLSAIAPIQIDDAGSIKCTKVEFEKQMKKKGAGMLINFNAGTLIIAQTSAQLDDISMEIE